MRAPVRDRQPLDVVGFLASIVAAAGMVLAVWALALVIVDDDPPAPKIMSAEDVAASGAPVVELGEMFVRGDLRVEQGATIAVVNTGSAPHNLAVEGGPITPDLDGGEATELELSTLDPGTYTAFCAIEGHRAAGMEAQLVVEGG